MSIERNTKSNRTLPIIIECGEGSLLMQRLSLDAVVAMAVFFVAAVAIVASENVFNLSLDLYSRTGNAIALYLIIFFLTDIAFRRRFQRRMTLSWDGQNLEFLSVLNNFSITIDKIENISQNLFSKTWDISVEGATFSRRLPFEKRFEIVMDEVIEIVKLRATK